jgi:hypothetical protein
VRTTLTLDDDVAIELRRLQRQRNESFRETVNALLRAGLSTSGPRKTGKRPVFRTEPASLGTPRLKSLDNISEVLGFAEGEEYR